MVCWVSNPQQFSEHCWNQYVWEVCSANQWDALQTVTHVASTGQPDGPNSPRRLTTCHTSSMSKGECIGLRSFASPAVFTWSLTNWLPLQHLARFLQEKCFHNQQDAENAFREFDKSWQILDFYATGTNFFLVGKRVDCNGSYFDMYLNLVIMI